MFVHEKTPLRGSDNFVPYGMMGDRHGGFRRKLRQYQCLLCSTLLLTITLAVVLVIFYYPDDIDMDYDNNVNQSNLQLPLKNAVLSTGRPILRSINKVETSKLAEDTFATAESVSYWKRSSSSGSAIDHITELSSDNNKTACEDSKYRSLNGICNNLVHPYWGSSGRPLKRLLPADYCDGMSSPRCSTSKSELPSPYFITSKITDWKDGSSQEYRNEFTDTMKLLWGEFVYRDLVDITEHEQPESLNLATSFLDGSNIYGHGSTSERKLRTFFNGELLSNEQTEYIDHSLNIKSSKCENFFVDFQIYDTMMIKQHNSIASKLKSLNTHWNDDKLYQEAKRIVIAQIQHVTYNEFLEDIIGKHQTEEFELRPYGFNKKYNNSVDPTVSNVFATTAFKSYFAQVTKMRKELEDEKCGFYSIAHVIQRGRNNGLPGYTQWRQFCGLSILLSFEDLNKIMGERNTDILKNIYNDIYDIDLFVGIISEIPVKGSLFGEVGMCLMTDQFKRIMFGDRYWYETDEIHHRFSEEQLTEIRKTTISKLICNNIENNEIFVNKKVSLECTDIPKINLTPWLENEQVQNNLKTYPNSIIELSNDYDDITEKLNKKKKKVVQHENTKSVLSLSQNLLSSKINPDVVKRSVSFTMYLNNITVSSNGSTVYEVYNQKPPILLPLDQVVDPNSYTTSTEVYVKGTIDGSLIVGNITLPLWSAGTQTDSLKVQFESEISFKWGNPFKLDGNTEYKCKVLFQSYTKLSSNNGNEQSVLLKSSGMINETISAEQCTIILVGMYYERPFYCSFFPWWCLEGKLFYWSGETRMVLKSTLSPSNSSISTKLKIGGLKLYSIKQKTEDVKIEKLFASVTVVTGQISGSFKNEETIEVMNGSPPMDIYVDHIISPNAYDNNGEVTFTGTPIDNSSVVGTFSVPYFPVSGSGVKKIFTANYTFDIVYKYGGSIGILDPSKTYFCKLMFPSPKKSSEENQPLLKNAIIPERTIKGKTPFGESCSIMLSGYYREPSFICSITPWWCTDNNIFHWTGVAEFTIKKKYNVSNVDSNSSTYKQMENDSDGNRTFVMASQFQKKGYDFEETFCCGHRFGGKVRSGWMKIKNSGFFQPYKTIWSGDFPVAIEMPIFWKPGEDDDKIELSNEFGHEVVWSCSIFRSTIEGSFLFPQYVGHGPPPLVNWMKGKFFIELSPEDNVSLYNIIIPGLTYNSRVNFHNAHFPNPIPFSPSPKESTSQEDVYSGTKAPLILLGNYSSDHRTFIWNGSFIIVFTKTAKDFMLF